MQLATNNKIKRNLGGSKKYRVVTIKKNIIKEIELKSI